MKSISVAGLLSLFVFATHALADPDGEIVGNPRILDGDTLAYSIRIYGVDTPETRQVCALANGDCYRCGEGAADFLHDMMRVRRSGRTGKRVTCEFTGDITYGRPVASCEVDGEDVGEALIKAGWAYAYRSFLSGPLRQKYIDAQDDAEAAKLGMWQGDHVSPSRWRNQGARITCSWP